MSKRAFLNFFEISSLVLLLLAVALLAAITTMHFAIHGAEAPTPDLKEMTVAEARAQTMALGLNLVVDNRFYSADVAAGHILSQSPSPGVVVRREWRVRVIESLGPQTVDVPDTVGGEERKAVMALRREGLNVGLVARLPFASAPQGTVLAQDPPAHAHGIARPTVDLLVAVPPASASGEIAMPNVVGATLAEAQNSLTKAGILAAPTVTTQKTAMGGAMIQTKSARPATVAAQQPAAGTLVDANAAVKLTLAQ